MLGEDFSDADQQSRIALSSLLAEDDQSKEKESCSRRFKLKSLIQVMGLSFLLVLLHVGFGTYYSIKNEMKRNQETESNTQCNTKSFYMVKP